MYSTISTFVAYLDKSMEKITNEVVERAAKRPFRSLLPSDDRDLQRASERKNLKRILLVPEEEWELHGEVFIQYDYLSEMLEESPLNARGMFIIVQRLLEKNLATNIVHQDARCFDIQGIDDYNFKYMTRDEFLEFVRTDEYGRLKNKEESELTEEEKKRLEEFNTYSDLHPLDIAPVIEAHKQIKEHYFDKKDSFNEEDIEIFLSVIKGFGLSDKIIDMFRNLLLREVSKRQRKIEVVENPVQVVSKPVIVEEPTISRKEYNLIERELRKYFDIRTMEAVGPLTLDLQIYCVGLLMKLGFSDEKIRDILKIMNKNGYGYDNPVSMFVALQEKLEYYKDVDGVREAIDTMIGAMTELTMSSDVEYDEWKTFMEDELAATLKLIPKTYDYEIEKAKKGGKK